jgi:hypothetical protein
MIDRELDFDEVMRKTHHEPLGLSESITWFAPPRFDPESAGYYAAQGNASRVFLKGEFHGELAQWRMVRAQQIPDLAYVGSSGFSKPQLYPETLVPLIRKIERAFARWPELFATRLLIVLEKKVEGEG